MNGVEQPNLQRTAEKQSDHKRLVGLKGVEQPNLLRTAEKQRAITRDL